MIDFTHDWPLRLTTTADRLEASRTRRLCVCQPVSVSRHDFMSRSRGRYCSRSKRRSLGTGNRISYDIEMAVSAADFRALPAYCLIAAEAMASAVHFSKTRRLSLHSARSNTDNRKYRRRRNATQTKSLWKRPTNNQSTVTRHHVKRFPAFNHIKIVVPSKSITNKP